jgi:hypothetical protein
MKHEDYEWGMALYEIHNTLEGALYQSLKTGKNRVRQKPKDYKKKKKAKRRMSKGR